MRFLPIDDGADLLDALRAGLAGADGWVQAVGHLEGAELRLAGEGPDPRRRCAGRWTLVSLSGPAGGPYGVVLARAAGATGELAAGLLLTGRAFGVLATLWTAEEAPRRARDEAPGPAEVATTNRPSASPSNSVPSPVAATSRGWAAAALAVAAATATGSEAKEEIHLEPGDRVDHPTFGACDVLRCNGERVVLRDRHGPGRIREIALDLFRVRRLADREGRRVFKLER